MSNKEEKKLFEATAEIDETYIEERPQKGDGVGKKTKTQARRRSIKRSSRWCERTISWQNSCSRSKMRWDE
jgi:hypothetical protein